MPGREQRGPQHMLRRTPLLLAGKTPEAIPRMTGLDVRPRTDADPRPTRGIIGTIHALRGPRQRSGGEIFEQSQPRQMRRMQTLGRLGRIPVEFRKYARGVIDGLPLAF